MGPAGLVGVFLADLADHTLALFFEPGAVELVGAADDPNQFFRSLGLLQERERAAPRP